MTIIQELIFLIPIKYDKNGLFTKLNDYLISESGVKFKIKNTKIVIKKEIDGETYAGKVSCSLSRSSLLFNRSSYGAISEDATKVYATDSIYILSSPSEYGEILDFYSIGKEGIGYHTLGLEKLINLNYLSKENLQFNNIQLVDGKIVADAKVVDKTDNIDEIKFAFTFDGSLHAEVLSIKTINE